MIGCLVSAAASAAEFAVDPNSASASDQNPGSADKPLKTLAKALELAKGGDTILLGSGDYPAVTISRTYDKPLTIGAAKGARPVMTGGLAIVKGGGLRISGLTFTWSAATRPASDPKKPFIAIENSKDVEIAGFELYDDPNLNQWVGCAASIGNSQGVTIRDGNAHNFYFGFSTYRSKDVTLRNLDIRMWSYEDGARVTECPGPVLIEGCHITNSGKAGAKGGHVDGIQSVYWNENITIRNCQIHGLGQGIGAFGGGKDGRRLKNWRVEGCLIYDTYAPHVCSIYDCDGVTLVNNTFPNNQPFLTRSTGIVLQNNIIGLGGGRSYDSNGLVADFNLWVTGAKVGEHDLAGVDPKFVNAPLLKITSDPARSKDSTKSKLFFRETLKGKLAVGDTVEVYVMDGSARDAKARKVTAVTDNSLEIDPPLEGDPGAGVAVFKWPAGTKDMVSDFRPKADSPAIDSADSSVKRGKDMDGHEPTDAPGVADTGAGDVKYLDRGAFEFVPAK
jgi:hypothetical protein